MLNSGLVKKAHEMAKEIKAQYPEVDYKFQYGLCLSYLLNNRGEVEMVELQGTEKQVKWATEIKTELIQSVKNYKENFNNATYNKRNYVLNFKEEIMKEYQKPTMGQAYEFLNNLLDSVIKNIENETSAKKLIDVKQSFKLADATIDTYLIKKFM